MLLSDSVPAQAFLRALERGALLISGDLAKELQDVLGRGKFDRYLTREERERLLVTVITQAELVHVSTVVQACRDPDDNAVLALAIDGCASCVVTGDKALLALDPFRGIRIITPVQFLDLRADAPRVERP